MNKELTELSIAQCIAQMVISSRVVGHPYHAHSDIILDVAYKNIRRAAIAKAEGR